MLDSKNHMLLTDGVMDGNFSTYTLCKNLDRTCRLYHNDTSLSGCQNSHYTTEKGKASELRELIVAHSEVLHSSWAVLRGMANVVDVISCSCKVRQVRASSMCSWSGCHTASAGTMTEYVWTLSHKLTKRRHIAWSRGWFIAGWKE